jgi:hypothetical protein
VKSGFASSPHSQEKKDRKKSKHAKLALKTFLKVSETSGMGETIRKNSFFTKRVSTAE